MIISSEQLERVLDYVKSGHPDGPPTGTTSSVSPELAARVRASVTSLPDVRPERIASARAHLAEGELSADDVAEKILARVLSDRLR